MPVLSAPGADRGDPRAVRGPGRVAEDDPGDRERDGRGSRASITDKAPFASTIASRPVEVLARADGDGPPLPDPADGDASPMPDVESATGDDGGVAPPWGLSWGLPWAGCDTIAMNATTTTATPTSVARNQGRPRLPIAGRARPGAGAGGGAGGCAGSRPSSGGSCPFSVRGSVILLTRTARPDVRMYSTSCREPARLAWRSARRERAASRC